MANSLRAERNNLGLVWPSSQYQSQVTYPTDESVTGRVGSIKVVTASKRRLKLLRATLIAAINAIG
ncbi:uncharacterized protein M421DRAFT_413922 [Didymella exigua CBS 183.55]|uniref:Uncharacterized protein n=1 Tax=Didymella exigua CBS 183.55 TaxID=1150837 RepID=A0A6A5RNK0_9PLEO|nr:uncharacterized protein M421DRAFT_413922 [Didymella exigua CBS 183.55]KAF1929985.1 hypothetical protein M421DRAFT_413922 [Didymella exigua CBS 183.55]